MPSLRDAYNANLAAKALIQAQHDRFDALSEDPPDPTETQNVMDALQALMTAQGVTFDVSTSGNPATVAVANLRDKFGMMAVTIGSVEVTLEMCDPSYGGIVAAVMGLLTAAVTS